MISETRPWGNYTVLHETPSHKIKTITVEPMRRLSYQTHEKRSEYWVIVSGAGTVTLDGTTSVCVAGDAFVIEQGVAHRIENTGTEELIFTEVQLGTYFGEDDIVRIEDDFGR
jgi:mannose-6-phosphate isomerase